MKTIITFLLVIFTASAQAYAPNNLLLPEPRFEYTEPAKGPFIMYATPYCLTAQDFTDIVIGAQWQLAERSGQNFAIYAHANGNFLWVERSPAGFCITASGDPKIGFESP